MLKSTGSVLEVSAGAVHAGDAQDTAAVGVSGVLLFGIGAAGSKGRDADVTACAVSLGVIELVVRVASSVVRDRAGGDCHGWCGIAYSGSDFCAGCLDNLG